MVCVLFWQGVKREVVEFFKRNMIKVVTERNELQESYDKLLEEYDSLKKEIELSEKKEESDSNTNENTEKTEEKGNDEVKNEYVEGYALFFLNGELVEYGSDYFMDDDSQIKPDETISKQITSYKEFDKIEFYFTGRR